MMNNNDFRTKMEHQIYGVRAAGLIVQNACLLTFYDKKKNLYTLPGGAIKVSELSEQAVLREIQEELGIDAKVDGLKFVVENHFKENGTNWHNIELYYLCHLEKEYEESAFKGDTGLGTKWLEIEKVHSYDIRPCFIKKEKLDLSLGICHIVHRDK